MDNLREGAGADSQDGMSDMIQEHGSPGSGTMVSMATDCQFELKLQSAVIAMTGPLSPGTVSLLPPDQIDSLQLRARDTQKLTSGWLPQCGTHNAPDGMGVSTHLSLSRVPRIVPGTWQALLFFLDP